MYYILPTGILYKFVGPGLNGTVFADVGADVYATPTLLSEAVQTPRGFFSFNYTMSFGWSATLTPNTGFSGKILAAITASDGFSSSTKKFNVLVS